MLDLADCSGHWAGSTVNSYRSPAMEIRDSAISGRGAFARVPIPAEHIVAIRTGSVVDYMEARTRDANIGGFSMQVEPGYFLCPDSKADAEDVAIYLNHSCDPNVGIRGQLTFVALRNIQAGEELTFDYATNVSFPYEISCSCGSPLCRGRVTGQDWLSPELQQKYAGHFDFVISRQLNGLPEATSVGRQAAVPLDGPVIGRIQHALCGFTPFDRWRDGGISRADYVDSLDSLFDLPSSLPANENERALSARVHWRDGEYVSDVLHTAVESGVLTESSYDLDYFEFWKDVIDREWCHNGRKTYIFPEEARLLFALASLKRPTSIVVLGSYYAYWAVWAVAGAGPALERAVLLDVDPAVADLATRNLQAIGLGEKVQVLVEEASKYLIDNDQCFDLFVLDAEGPRDTGPPRFRGKAVYGPIAEAARSRMRPGDMLVAHNILLDESVNHPYFRSLAGHNRAELSEFLDHMSTCTHQLELATTEGLGVYIA